MRNAIGASLAVAVLAAAAALWSPPDARAAGGGGLASCSYQYSRWQATESAYWRDLYVVCVNVADERAQD